MTGAIIVKNCSCFQGAEWMLCFLEQTKNPEEKGNLNDRIR
jgi:hypothetical protein